MKRLCTTIALLFLIAQAGCNSGKNDFSENEIIIHNKVLTEIVYLYEANNFLAVDALLEKHKNDEDLAEYLLHRNLMRMDQYPKLNRTITEVIPVVVLNDKKNEKKSFLSQSYQEYFLMLQGKSMFIDGECPAMPTEAACSCRTEALLEANSTSDFFEAQRIMWFSEYVTELCPNDELKSLQLFSATVVSSEKATALLTKEMRERSEEEYKALEFYLCRYANVYSEVERPYIYFHKSRLINCNKSKGELLPGQPVSN